jgi:hypothetical protein
MACHYNAGNAPVQLLCPKTRWSRGHYGLLTFTMISVLDQLQLDVCPLVGQLRFERAPMTCNLWSDLSTPQLGRSFAVERGYSFLQNKRRYGLLCYWRRCDVRGGGSIGDLHAELSSASPTVAHNKCWTTDRLARRGLDHPDKCPLCDQEESIDHRLVSCVFAWQFWPTLLQRVQLQALASQLGTMSFMD